MSIQKKSLISTLQTAKKANVASTSVLDGEAKGSKVSSLTKVSTRQALTLKSTKTTLKSFRKV